MCELCCYPTLSRELVPEQDIRENFFMPAFSVTVFADEEDPEFVCLAVTDGQDIVARFTYVCFE